ncbi:MAG: hypothetical protein AAGJ32_12170 [Pseudomonadota bacterium]
MSEQRFSAAPFSGASNSRFVRVLTVAVLASCLTGCIGWFAGSGTSAAKAQWLPGPLQTAQMGEGVLIPAAGSSTEVRRAQYIVKIKSGEAEGLTRLYFRDQGAAEASYRDWASDKPLFSKMDLVACSYGGEFVLSHEFTGDSSRDAAASPDALLEALRSHPLVAYADPDFVAQVETG